MSQLLNLENLYFLVTKMPVIIYTFFDLKNLNHIVWINIELA